MHRDSASLRYSVNLVIGCVVALQPSVTSFDYFGCNVIVHQDGQLLLVSLSVFMNSMYMIPEFK